MEPIMPKDEMATLVTLTDAAYQDSIRAPLRGNPPVKQVVLGEAPPSLDYRT